MVSVFIDLRPDWALLRGLVRCSVKLGNAIGANCQRSAEKCHNRTTGLQPAPTNRKIGIGGVVAHSPLPHHPAGGSAPGGKVEPLRAGGSIRLSPQGLRRSAGCRFGFTVF